MPIDPLVYPGGVLGSTAPTFGAVRGSADPLAAIRAQIKAGKIQAAKPKKPAGLFDSTAATGTRLSRLEHIVKLLAAKLPSSELEQAQADVAKLT